MLCYVNSRRRSQGKKVDLNTFRKREREYERERRERRERYEVGERDRIQEKVSETL